MKKARRQEHGGSLLLKKRKSRRPLDLNKFHHLVLKSDFAYGERSLLQFRKMIKRVIRISASRFHIKIFAMAIVGNHIHLQIFGKDRLEIQNFFRVSAGHIAQKILKKSPLKNWEVLKRNADSKNKLRLNENKFWQSRVYSRVVSWGFDCLNVWAYIIQNKLEAANIIPYRKRKKYIKNFSKGTDSA
jgi:REP element-mobilizing transposase RayT